MADLSNLKIPVYRDGAPLPNDMGGLIILFNNAGNLAHVGTDNPLPFSLVGGIVLGSSNNVIGHVIVDNTNSDGASQASGASPVVIATDQIAANQIKGYTASYGRLAVTTQTTNGYPLSIFNAANSGKGVIITRLRVELNGGAGEFRLASTTVDPAYPSAATEQANTFGGAASGLSITFNSTAQTLPGTFFEDIQLQNNTPYELIPPGEGWVLPKGSSANGLTIWAVPSGAGSSIICLKYIVTT